MKICLENTHTHIHTHTNIISIECCTCILLLHAELQVRVVIGYPFLIVLGIRSHDLMVATVSKAHTVPV